jgi:hypothetical protein
MDGEGFIRELCVALEHRWKPEEFFVLFTAYFDEADTHGAAPHMAMGALLGHAREWELFGRRLKIIQKTEDFKIFHATKFKASKGKFEGWSREKSMRVVNNLTEIIRKNLTEGVLINLPYQRFQDEYRGGVKPKGIALDSQYGVCFRALMTHLVEILRETGNKHRLHVVVERGHPSALNTERVFQEIKQILKIRGIDLLGDWTLASKEERSELMMADYLVHSYAIMIRPGGSGLTVYADSAPEPKKSDAGLTFLEFQPDSLRDLKLQMRQHRLERQKYNRQQKVAAKAKALIDPSVGVLDE